MFNRIQVTAIGGVTCSGKTALVEQVIETLSVTETPVKPIWNEVMPIIIFPEARIVILGEYGQTAQGTDHLTRFTQKDLVSFVRWCLSNKIADHVIYEGTRLFDIDIFIELATKMTAVLDLRIMILTVSEPTQRSRMIHMNIKTAKPVLNQDKKKLADLFTTFRNTGAVHILPSEHYKLKDENVKIVTAGLISRYYSEGKATRA